jgi:hypothetical protein
MGEQHRMVVHYGDGDESDVEWVLRLVERIKFGVPVYPQRTLVPVTVAQ